MKLKNGLLKYVLKYNRCHTIYNMKTSYPAKEYEYKIFGFTTIAERLNGRLAMIGFLIGVATEMITGQGILSQLGLM